jgi:ABC-2 type transport system permease protein
VSGFNPLTTLSGQRISAGEGLGLAAAAVGVYLMPIAGVAAIALLLSTTLRNSAAAVVGTLMFSLLLQLAVIIPGLGGITPYLLSTQFNAWQGLLRSPVDWEPIVRAAWVCSAYTLPALLIALVFFLRRDVTGG